MIESENLESIIQQAWERFLGLPLRKLNREPIPQDYPEALVGWSHFAQGDHHALGILVSPGLARRVSAQLFDKHVDDVTDADMQDAITELTSIVSGNARGGEAITPPAPLPTIIETAEAIAFLNRARTRTVLAYECQGFNVVIMSLSASESMSPKVLVNAENVAY